MIEGDIHLYLRVLNDTILLVRFEQVFIDSCSHDGSIAVGQGMQVLPEISGWPAMERDLNR